MRLACFNAIVAKPAWNAVPTAWDLVPPAPIFNVAGAAGPFNLGLPNPVLPSAMCAAGNIYSEVQVSPASCLFDAITAGYGTLSELLALTGNPATASAVRSHAAARSHLLRANLDWPAGPAPGPIYRGSVPYIETSEKVLLSYLLGQTIAQRVAKNSWNVPRVFHRSLYGPLLPAMVGGPLPPGLSPDFVFLGALAIPPGGGPPALGLGMLEAKGTSGLFNPAAMAKDRERINKAFRTQIAPLVYFLGAGGTWNCGVSVACSDDALGPNRVVGQLWDPPNMQARPIERAGVDQLVGRYFKALHLLLSSLEGRSIQDGGGTVEWEARSIGFRIQIAQEQWEWMEQLAAGRLPDDELLRFVTHLPPEPESDVDGVANSDGLTLELIDF